jgi:hypothetical protein
MGILCLCCGAALSCLLLAGGRRLSLDLMNQVVMIRGDEAEWQ